MQAATVDDDGLARSPDEPIFELGKVVVTPTRVMIGALTEGMQSIWGYFRMKIFVAYPYAFEGYRESLASSLSEPGFELQYADDHVYSDHVLRKIEAMLAKSDLALFDITDANPNVTLELGIAIAASHPYIVAVRRDFVGKMNADIHGWDQVRYDTVEQLSEKLKDLITQGRAPARPLEKQPLRGQLWLYTEAPQSMHGGPSMIQFTPTVRNVGSATVRGFTVQLFFNSKGTPANRQEWTRGGTPSIPIYERHFELPVYPEGTVALPFVQVNVPHGISTADIGWSILCEDGRFPSEEGTFLPILSHPRPSENDAKPYRPAAY